ncbi:hypothetical protein BKA70DRAFT_1214844 [Coprinopsis sp. MPI-PUGE-AT-0042]|nr:hypothetical protein BKA70DRAFT_1214844 [Coprinopsis sp. MPI-PUGE-AT-0042]
MAIKRKNDLVNPEPSENTGKKVRLSEGGDDAATEATALPSSTTTHNEQTPTVTRDADLKGKGTDAALDSHEDKEDVVGMGKSKRQTKKHKIRKLAPARPFPLVPTSVSATGPRSAHKEGKNFICITRRSGLGAYLRRCKDVILKDGYKKLHLSAMGAAIPLLLQLSCALPAILPYAKHEITSEVLTGTCEVQDEVQPEDDDEDTSIQSRFKSTLQIVLTIGDGKFEGDTTGPARKAAKPKALHKPQTKRGKEKATGHQEQVFFEPEQEDDLMEGV